MPTSYTPILKLALPVTGELSNTWGDITNQQITSMVEQAVAGLATINTWTTNSHTLTTADGTTSESRCAMLVIDDDGVGNPSAAATVICPTATKAYIVRNLCGQTVTVKTSAGTGVAVPNNQAALVFCDGVNVVTGAFNGDVVGPASATDNAIVRFDGATGKIIQNSVITIADTTGNMAGVGTLGVGAITTSGALTYGGVTLNNAVTGTGNMVLSTSPTLVTPALGTPASGVLTNATGLPISTGVSGLGTGVATFLGTPTSANLAAAVTNETGTGALVFATSPALVTPALGTPASGVLTNATGLPISTGVSGLGTGVATALAVNVGTAGAPVVNGGVLGTPSSGTVTNLTGTASININGTVGATTATTGSFTTLAASSPASFAAGTALLPSITRTGDTNTGMWFPAADTIAFSEGGTEAMRIDSSGNVGIGTTAPGQKLEVASSTNDDGVRITNTSTASATTKTTRVGFFGTDITGILKEAGDIYVIPDNANYIDTRMGFYTRGSDVVAQRMVITSTGNVGIGTNTPGASLHVAGLIAAAPTGEGALLGAQNNYGVVHLNGTNGGYIDFSTSGVDFKGRILYDNSLNQFRIATNAIDRMTIDSSGNVGIGTGTPSYRLDAQTVNGTTSRFYVTDTSNLTDAPVRIAKGVNDTSVSNRFVIFTINSDGNGSGQINANGASQAAFGSFSDRRLKENITDLPPQLANIMALRPVEFDYIQSMGGGHQISFIAQDFETVYPDAVGKDENGMKTLTGWDKTSARLVKAIQELKAEFDAYKATHP